MEDKEQEVSAHELGRAIAWILATCATTVLNCSPGVRAYTMLTAAYSLLLFLGAASSIPVPWLGQSLVILANYYVVMMACHFAKQRQNQRRGVMVHSGSFGLNIFEAVFPRLQEGRWIHRVTRNLLTFTWITAISIAAPGAGIVVALGWAAQNSLSELANQAEQMVQQDMFDAMIEAESRRLRVEEILRRNGGAYGS